MDLYSIIDEYLERGSGGALATIVKKLGAAPREEGAKMFVGSDGKFYGTVGGGCTEAEVWQEARKVIKTGAAKLLHYTMDGKQLEEDGMICGGNVDIFVEPVADKYRTLYRAIPQLERQGVGALLITRFSEREFSKSLIREDGVVLGDAPGEEARTDFQQYLREKKPVVSGNTVVEPLQTSPVLYVFGAGHVSQYVSRVATMVDFNVTVIDDREEFANTGRFPEAERVIADDFLHVFDQLSFHGNEYVVILTRGHKHDALVLEQVMRRPTRYVGMIGSKRKTRMVMDYMKQRGFDEKALGSVYAPIGISINSETPQEIAVSIVAELIKVRRERA
ncbi:MAG TPA: XdhC/CoxI family protein [Syntrophorhabdales bacterium]|nr:XdhC/CoxI family protein [Syntrophorhabdales bacterium]